MSNPVYTEASSSVLTFAENLIKNFHPHLQQARICFVFRSEAQKQGDRLILGQCTKIPAKMQPYLEYDFLIWLSEEDYSKMPDIQREALIDHELCHCGYNLETGCWTLRQHDIQEFAAVIQRHGIWSPDVRRIKSAIDAYETQTLPGLMMSSLAKAVGGVVTMSGSDLARASKALEEQA